MDTENAGVVEDDVTTPEVPSVIDGAVEADEAEGVLLATVEAAWLVVGRPLPAEDVAVGTAAATPEKLNVCPEDPPPNSEVPPVAVPKTEAVLEPKIPAEVDFPKRPPV